MIDIDNAVQMRIEEVADEEIRTNDPLFQEFVMEHATELARFVSLALDAPRVAIYREGHEESFCTLAEDVARLRHDFYQFREQVAHRRGELEQWAAEARADCESDVPAWLYSPDRGTGEAYLPPSSLAHLRSEHEADLE